MQRRTTHGQGTAARVGRDLDRPSSPVCCGHVRRTSHRDARVERRVLHRGRFITFRIDTIEDAAGGRHTREVVEHPGAVCIVPVLGDDVLMVRQFRTPIGRRSSWSCRPARWTACPTARVEDPDDAAPRELGEETGYRAAQWRSLGRFWSAPGFTEELHAPLPGHGPRGHRRLRRP